MPAYNHNALDAKIKAMRGKLLRAADYEQLALIKTVEEFSRRLKEYQAYEKTLGGTEELGLHRGDIERRLAHSIADDFTRIYSFIGDADMRAYLDAVNLRNEVEILKLLLCTIYDERPVAYTLPELSHLLRKTQRLDLPSLLASKTVEAFVERLRGTEFYATLSKPLQGTYRLFDLEMSLDLYYYLHRHALQERHLNKQDKAAMGYVNGVEVDLQNIRWAYRLKTYYKLDEAQIYACLIPLRYKLKKPALAAIVEARGGDALHNAVLATPYGKAIARVASVDEGCKAAIFRTIHAAARAHPHTIVPTVVYIRDKETEVKSIVSLLESIRYGLRREEALAYVTHTR